MRAPSLILLACLMLATHPTPLSAAPIPQISLVDLCSLPGWNGAPVGNVVIMTPEGKHLQLTKMASAQQPKASTSTSAGGLVGWIDCSKPGEPAVLNVVKGLPIGSSLILSNPSGFLLTITAKKAIIEAWGFDPDCLHVVLKSRALHGPAMIERFLMKDGSQAGSCPAYGSHLPSWALPYSDEGDRSSYGNNR